MVSSVVQPAFLGRIRERVAQDAVAVKMSYPERLEPKVVLLQECLGQLTQRLEPFVQAVLFNTSIKPNHIETMLGFLKRLSPRERQTAAGLFPLLWPCPDPEAAQVGLSEDKPARLVLQQRLAARLDLLRRFTKTAPLSAWDPRPLRQLARTLRITHEEALELVCLRPRILRGLVKPPRPVYACLPASLLAMAAVLALSAWIPWISAGPLYLTAMGITVLVTWYLSMHCAIAPGVLCYEPTRRRLSQALVGGWQPSGVVGRLTQLGVNVNEYHRARRQEDQNVRVEVRDKRSLQGAMQFLTSSEEIGNCIALRNFVSWTLPALLDDESIVLADVSCKGSGLWQQRAQLWMVAGEREGRPVLTVNSLEFNNEGAKHLEALMPHILETLREVARRAGFEAIYVGISNFGRAWFDGRFPQARGAQPIWKVHSPELGWRYYFDAYRRRGSRFQFMQKRSLGACAYALVFGCLELIQGNRAKGRDFLDSAHNRNNCWVVDP